MKDANRATARPLMPPAACWLLSVAAGCTPPPPHVELALAEAGPPAATPLRLQTGTREICALDSLRAFCISGALREGAPFSVRVGPPGTAEVVGACHRSEAGVVRCQGVESAQDAASIAASPYALRKDGTVVALDVDDDAEHARTYEHRRSLAASLGVVKKIVRGPHGACALRTDETVVCWTEPWTLSFGSNLAAPKVRIVPGVSGVVDLFMYSWLQLCVLDHAGTVRCSAPPPQPLDSCVMHGKDARCGRSRPGQAVALQGPTFDPADLMTRPLDVVTTGATSMGAFQWPAFEFLEVGGQSTLSDVDPGGCAARPDGVVCWNRSPCAGRRWTVAPVQGLPAGARLSFGAHRGYGLTADGVLYTFPRRDVRPHQRGDDPHCDDEAAYAPPTIHATQIKLAPVHDVAGGLIGVTAMPGYAAADCASLRDGSVWCWRSDADQPLGAPALVPLP